MSESLYKTYRPAGPNERRVIIRQSLGLYGSLVIGGIYTLNRSRLQPSPSRSPSASHPDQPSKLSATAWHALLIKALRHCVLTHPILGSCIWAEDTEHPYYAAGPSVQLDQQISHINVDVDWHGAEAGSVLAAARDDPHNWHETLGCSILQDLSPRRLGMEGKHFRPAWRVGVQELPPGVDGSREVGDGASSGASGKDVDRFLITLTFSHGLGDGMSGLAFHRTLLEGLNLALVDGGAGYPYKPDPESTGHDETGALSVIQRSELAPSLPPPIEEATKLTVSLRYMLAPLLGEYLPSFLARLLGFRATIIPEDGAAWLGRENYFPLDPDADPAAADTSANLTTTTTAQNHSSPPAGKKPQGLVWLRIPAQTVRAAVAQCRARGRQTRMTGLLHQLIVRALSETLPEKNARGELIGSIVTQTAVNLRRAVQGLGEDDMALCVTGYYEVFERERQSSASAGAGAVSANGSGEGVGVDGNADASNAASTASTSKWTTWPTAPASHPLWTAARATTAALERQASTTHNQPITLLRYLTNMRRWTSSRLGKRREASYEISNLGVFDPWTHQEEKKKEKKKKKEEAGQVGGGGDDGSGDDGVRKEGRVGREKAVFDIESMVFSQPANAVGGVFDVNVVTVRGGEMVVCFCWQPRALGLVDDGDGGGRGDGSGTTEEEEEQEGELEDRFMRRVAGSLRRSLDELAAAEVR